jgi:hypothetical protein
MLGSQKFVQNHLKYSERAMSPRFSVAGEWCKTCGSGCIFGSAQLRYAASEGGRGRRDGELVHIWKLLGLYDSDHLAVHVCHSAGLTPFDTSRIREEA